MNQQNNPLSIEDLVIYNSLSAAMLVRMKDQKMTDQDISDLMQDGPQDVVLDLFTMFTTFIDGLATSRRHRPGGSVDEWLINLANQAVAKNLKADGTPVYDSAQGYACAMDALRLVFRLPEEKGSEDVSVVQDAAREEQVRTNKLYSRAFELYQVTSNKYDESVGVKMAVDYIMEQNGIVDAEPEDRLAFEKRVMERFKEMENPSGQTF